MAGTPTAKNYDVTKMHQGPGDLWVIGSPPADSTAPMLTLTNGTPDSTAHPSSVHLGATNGAITSIVKPKFDNITVDQFDAPVAHFLQSIEMSIEADLEQIDPAIMQQALPFGVYTTQASPGYKMLTFGGQPIGTPIAIACIAALRGSAGLYVVSLMFAAHGTIGLNTAVGRAKASTYKAQFDGLADTTRTAGRQVGVFYVTQ